MQDDGDSVMVAICDPANYDAQDAIRYRLGGKNADFVVLTSGDVKRLLDKLYPLTFDPNATDTGENLVAQLREKSSPEKTAGKFRWSSIRTIIPRDAR